VLAGHYDTVYLMMKGPAGSLTFFIRRKRTKKTVWLGSCEHERLFRIVLDTGTSNCSFETSNRPLIIFGDRWTKKAPMSGCSAL